MRKKNNQTKNNLCLKIGIVKPKIDQQRFSRSKTEDKKNEDEILIQIQLIPFTEGIFAATFYLYFHFQYSVYQKTVFFQF